MEFADEAAQTADVLTDAVQAAKQGDGDGFRYAYRAVQPGLLRYLTALVGAAAEDVASETWTQVCRDFAAFTGDGDGFRAWVATIGRHRALDQLRSHQRRGTDPAPAEVMSGLPAPDDPAASALESMSTQAALARILSLPPDRAEAILLRVVIGVDAKSAARILGKRPGAVRMAACRGLRQLAADLQETTEEPEPVLRAGVTQPGLSTLT